GTRDGREGRGTTVMAELRKAASVKPPPPKRSVELSCAICGKPVRQTADHGNPDRVFCGRTCREKARARNHSNGRAMREREMRERAAALIGYQGKPRLP